MGGARRKNQYTGCALENRAAFEGEHLRFTADAHTLRGEGEPTQKNSLLFSSSSSFPVPDCWFLLGIGSFSSTGSGRRMLVGAHSYNKKKRGINCFKKRLIHLP